jgi:hypothetical protein
MAGDSSSCGWPSAVSVQSGTLDVFAVAVIPFSCQVSLGLTLATNESSNASRFVPGKKRVA